MAFRRIKVDIDEVLELDAKRRELMQKSQELRALRNEKSSGKPTDVEIKEMMQAASCHAYPLNDRGRNHRIYKGKKDQKRINKAKASSDNYQYGMVYITLKLPPGNRI